MRYLPDGRQMKAADAYTIQTLKVPSLVLMERAAGACVRFVQEKGFDCSHICVVCGSGNNGGDGFAIARMFLLEGMKVTVFAVGNEAHFTEEAAYQKRLYEEAGGVSCDRFVKGEYSIIIDALFGVGLSREITGRYYELLVTLNEMQGVKIAVDIPSGVSADTGAALGTAFRADYTVTFQAEKLGTALYPGKDYAGEVITADIGISEEPFKKDGQTALAPDVSEYRQMLPRRKADSNKGTYGRLLVIAGSKGMSGAAYLNALGAYRTGAGLVRIYTVQENRTILQIQLPEAIVTTYDLYDERELMKLLAWADAVCIGSGIGTGEKARKILRTTLEYVQVPCVIDADGLNLLAEDKKLKEKLCGKNIILTPHMKEFSRMTGLSVDAIRSDRVRALREFVEEVNAACILKDARTLILTPGERLSVNLSGCAAMAKAGAGDVLAGIAGGLLAQGLSVKEAALLGVYLHGCAGQCAAEAVGNHSLLAREIAENIGNVMKDWEVQKDERV